MKNLTTVPLPVCLDWRYRLKLLKKRFYERLPFIKRRRYRAVYEDSSNLRAMLFDIDSMLASKSVCDPVFDLRDSNSKEICLFVTYASQDFLKPHVVDHVTALLDLGIDVILIINSDFKAANFKFPEDLLMRLRGAYFRDNLGFDFGAWAQVTQLVPDIEMFERLLWINDSIVGPLDLDIYRQLIYKIRKMPDDLVGLTENYYPRYHLQSFFLVFNQRLLQDKRFFSFVFSVLNLPKKQNVIDFYETELTSFILELGFSSGCVFRNISYKDSFKDETTRSWRSLIARGFPFIKASVLVAEGGVEHIRGLVPKFYAPDANRDNR